MREVRDELELWNKQTLLVGCERVEAGGQLSGTRRQSNFIITVCFCCRSFWCLSSPQNSGLWPQRPDLTGLELGRHGWGERANSLPEGSWTARVLRRHRSADGWEAGGSEWEQDTGDLKELNGAPDNRSLWRRPLPQCLRICVLSRKEDQTESVPGSQIPASFSLSPKAKSGERRELLTAPSPSVGMGAGDCRRFLPYAGRAHWSRG